MAFIALLFIAGAASSAAAFMAFRFMAFIAFMAAMIADKRGGKGSTSSGTARDHSLGQRAKAISRDDETRSTRIT